MAKVLVTGSSDGLGWLTAKSLMEKGHELVLHARDQKRKMETLNKIHGEMEVLTGDFTDFDDTIELTDKINALGKFDVIIHNAGVYNESSENVLRVNVLAPYILTCLVQRPKRLIYLVSDMHFQGNPTIDFSKGQMKQITYSDTKLYVLMLSMAVAKKWPETFSNTVDPGWVPTKMGGSSAPGSLIKGVETQIWLATSVEKEMVSGKYFHNKKPQICKSEANTIKLQDELLMACQELTGIPFPE